MTPLLRLHAIECRYRGHTVVKNLSLAIEPGDIAALVGPSGCGKTTVLRAIAGFEPVYDGQIDLRGELVSRPGFSVVPEKRGLGMVFQDFALFPHMTALQNIQFGLRNMDARAQTERARESLALVGMAESGARYPHELSGGQKQRVALARALAPRPELILLDEPFSSLDVELRDRLGVEVRDLLKALRITGLIVTHDQNEAFAVCDYIGVMQGGQIVQWDTPYNLYHEPAHRFVADFIGQGEFLIGTLLSPHTLSTEVGVIRSKKPLEGKLGTQVDVLLRPDDVVADAEGNLRAEIIQKAFKGAEILYTLRLATGGKLLSLFPSHHNHEVGEMVNIRIAAEHLVTFARE